MLARLPKRHRTSFYHSHHQPKPINDNHGDSNQHNPLGDGYNQPDPVDDSHQQPKSLGDGYN